MQPSDEYLEELIDQVRKTDKYALVSKTLVRKIVEAEIPKWKTAKEIIKSTRNKIHQVGSAFQETTIPYKNWEKELIGLPQDIKSTETELFIKRCCQMHSSTAERLPFISSFFAQTLAPIQPVESILDLACGFSPLCIPWMPVSDHASYTGI